MEAMIPEMEKRPEWERKECPTEDVQKLSSKPKERRASATVHVGEERAEPDGQEMWKGIRGVEWWDNVRFVRGKEQPLERNMPF